MNGANDMAGETFTWADVDTLGARSKASGIAGLPYTNEFVKDLGL
ncbi:MAG TPA: hypothetical protein VF798_02950 [Burkholderiaceae bacterium]